MTVPEEETQSVFKILQSLSHTEFVYLLADLYSIRGWVSSITTGDPDTVGDVVVSQILPEPKSIGVYYYDDEGLSKEELSERLEDLNQDKLIIVVSGAPSDEAMSLSQQNPVSIIGVGDIAEDVVHNSTIDVLREHIGEESPLLNKHKELFNQHSKRSDSSTDSTREPSSEVVENESTTPATTRLGGTIEAENEFYSVEYLGHGFVSGDEGTGTVVALEISAKEHDMQIKPTHFSLQDASDYAYQGLESDIPLLDPVVDRLSPPWRGASESTPVPRKGRIKLLLLFASSDPVAISRIQHSCKLQDLLELNIMEIKSETDYHDTDHVDIELQFQTDSEPIAQSNLPVEVSNVIDDLDYTIHMAE